MPLWQAVQVIYVTDRQVDGRTIAYSVLSNAVTC